MQFFIKFSIYNVDWNVENGHDENESKNSLSSSLLWGYKWSFQLENYLKLSPKYTKNPKISNFQSFYAVFVKFMMDFVDWNVKKGVNKEKICCPVGFSEELIDVFKLTIFSNWHQKRQKTQNFQTFKVFMQLLSNLWQTSVDWNNEQGQPGTNCLSSRFFRRVNCRILKISQIGTEFAKKTQNFPFFQCFYATFFLNFR